MFRYQFLIMHLLGLYSVCGADFFLRAEYARLSYGEKPIGFGGAILRIYVFWPYRIWGFQLSGNPSTL